MKPSYASMKSRNSFISPEFLSGKCAIAQGLGYVFRDMRDTKKFPFNFKVGIVYPPVMKAGDPIKNTTAGVQFLSINPNSKHKDEAFKAILYYIQKGAKNIAPLNVPPIVGSNDDTLNAFIQNTPVSKDDAKKFFDKENQLKNPTIMGIAAVEYQTAINEESDKYLNGAQDLNTTISNIKKKADTAIDKAKGK